MTKMPFKCGVWSFFEGNRENKWIASQMVISRDDFTYFVYFSKVFSDSYFLTQYLVKYAQLRQSSFNSAPHSRQVQMYILMPELLSLRCSWLK